MPLEHKDCSSAIPASVGQAACGIVHDLANLIQTIILRAEVTAATEPVSENCIKRMEQIVDDGQLGANLIRSLLEFARKSVEALEPVDIRELVARAVTNAENASAVRVDCSFPLLPMVVKADPSQLDDLVTIAVEELSKAADPNARYSVSLNNAKPEGDALTWMSEEQWVELKIERHGEGPMLDIEEGHLSASAGGRPPDEHTMNLMRVRGIIRQHRGQIRSREEVEDGRQSLIVEAYLPLA